MKLKTTQQAREGREDLDAGGRFADVTPEAFVAGYGRQELLEMVMERGLYGINSDDEILPRFEALAVKSPNLVSRDLLAKARLDPVEAFHCFLVTRHVPNTMKALEKLRFPMVVARGVRIPERQEPNLEHLGVFWTREGEAEAYWGDCEDRLWVFQAEIHDSSVDWRTTLANNVVFPHEDEICLKKGALVYLVSVQDGDGAPPNRRFNREAVA